MASLTGRSPRLVGLDLLDESESEEYSTEELVSTDQSDTEEEGQSKKRRSITFNQSYNVSEVNLDFVELKEELAPKQKASRERTNSPFEKHVLESTDQEEEKVTRMDLMKAQ